MDTDRKMDRKMRVIVVGASGRMGREMIRGLCAASDMVLHAAIARAANPNVNRPVSDLAGVNAGDLRVCDTLDEAALLADGLVDFTQPEALFEHAEIAAQGRFPLIVGTTGLEKRHLDALKAASAHCAIVYSQNMSLGICLLSSLVAQTARALGNGFDIEICEMHHRDKVDAPSGTAKWLGESAARARGQPLEAVAQNHQTQPGPREAGAIGFASLRGGGVVGDHDVVFASGSERVLLSHRADARSLFAQGAIQALRWAQNQSPGLYGMQDVLGLAQ